MIENGFLKISFKKYCLIDLIMFSIFIYICEMISYFVNNSAINDIYFTFSILVYSIVIFRWNFKAILPGAIGFILSIVTIYLVNGGNLALLFVNALCNISAILISFIFYLNKDKLIIKEKIRNNLIYKILYFISPFIVIGLFTGVFAVILKEGKFINTVIHYLLNYEILSIFASILVGCLLSKHQSLLVDQKEYIDEIVTRKEKNDI